MVEALVGVAGSVDDEEADGGTTERGKLKFEFEKLVGGVGQAADVVMYKGEHEAPRRGEQDRVDRTVGEVGGRGRVEVEGKTPRDYSETEARAEESNVASRGSFEKDKFQVRESKGLRDSGERGKESARLTEKGAGGGHSSGSGGQEGWSEGSR